MKKNVLTLFTCLYIFIAYGQNTLQDSNSCLAHEQNLYLKKALDDSKGADAYLDSLKSCGFGSPENFLNRVNYLFSSGDIEGAGELLFDSDNQDLVDGELKGAFTFLMALIKSSQGLDQEAVDFYGECIAVGYNPHWSYNNAGLIFDNHNQTELAIKYYDMAIAYDSTYDKAYANLGDIYTDQLEFKKALEFYKTADRLTDHVNPGYRYDITSTYYEMKEVESCMASAQIGMKLYPENWDCIKGMALGLVRNGDYEGALECARKLEAKNMRSFDAYFDIAYLYDIGGDEETAVYYYTICLEINPNHVYTLLNLAIYYRQSGNFEKAHSYLDKCLEIEPDYYYALNVKIQAYMWEHNYEEALEWCNVFCDLKSNVSYCLLNKGYVLLLLKRYNEAIPFLYKQIELHKEDDRAWNNLGASYTGLNQYDSAQYCFNKALLLDSNNSYAYHNRALLKSKMGDFEGACADLSTAIDMEYNWVISEELIKMRNEYCSDVEINREILIYSYKGNVLEKGSQSFITLLDSLVDEEIRALETDSIIYLAEPLESSQFSAPQYEIQVFPNPAIDQITIQSHMKLQEFQVKIFDMTGRLYRSEQLSGKINKLDFSSLKSGNYILLFLNDSKVLSSQKIIVQ